MTATHSIGDTINCNLCGKGFVAKSSRHRFCSLECGRTACVARSGHKEPWAKRRLGIERSCVRCGTAYCPVTPRQRFCREDCGKAFLRDAKPVRFRGIEEKTCAVCGEAFHTEVWNKKYCKLECQRIGYGKVAGREVLPPVMTCRGCGVRFSPGHRFQQYCNACRDQREGHSAPDLSLSRELPSVESCLALPRSSMFGVGRDDFVANLRSLILNNEQEFHRWFELNCGLIGIRRLIKSNPFFPDVRAELHNGRIIDIELEYYASNFIKHGHDPMQCDLVFSYYKTADQREVSGVPVLSVFSVKHDKRGNYDLGTREVTDYFRELAFVNGVLLARLMSGPRRSKSRDRQQRRSQDVLFA